MSDDGGGEDRHRVQDSVAYALLEEFMSPKRRGEGDDGKGEGRLPVKLPPDTHLRLKVWAAARGMSLAAAIEWLLAQHRLTEEELARIFGDDPGEGES